VRAKGEDVFAEVVRHLFCLVFFFKTNINRLTQVLEVVRVLRLE
jgi:hypothetical protein